MDHFNSKWNKNYLENNIFSLHDSFGGKWAESTNIREATGLKYQVFALLSLAPTDPQNDSLTAHSVHLNSSLQGLFQPFS